LVLKGALMFTAWQSPVTRSTRDIDLLGHMDNTIEHVVSAMRSPGVLKGIRLLTPVQRTWRAVAEQALELTFETLWDPVAPRSS
jgi:hypothetical protein